jgi:AcrR family transcriptional regulator
MDILATAPANRFAAEARRLGKSARTRARLMDAAVGVFARDGFESASVNEIARAAEVANGTFYVYFRDKDEIAAEVAFRIAQQVALRLDEAMVEVEDAVERVSLATRRFVELAVAEPSWGWALVRAVGFLPDLRRQVVAYLRADLERGVRQGDFTVEVDDLLCDVFAAMLTAALMARLRGDSGPEAGARVAALQLRMLGVEPDRAESVAARPLAAIALSLPGPNPD